MSPRSPCWLPALLGATVTLGCGQAAPPESQSPVGISREVEHADFEEEVKRTEAVGEDVVVQAARGFSGVRAADGEEMPAEIFLSHLAEADVVCVGERHDQPLDHYAQLRILEGLVERQHMRGFELGVGLEMVRTRYQAALANVDEEALLGDEFEENTRWNVEWGFPLQLYRPQLLTAHRAGASLVALGVDRDVTRIVARDGLAALPPREAAGLPELDLEDSRHREVFDEMMQGHPAGGHGDLDQFYVAQVIWDESMAETAAKFVAARAPARKIVVMAGAAHCQRTAIPARVEKRGDFQVLSVLPVDPEAEANPLANEYDYLMVFEADPE